MFNLPSGKGMKIILKEDAVKFTDTAAGKLQLKAKDERLEVVHVEAKQGKSLCLHPYECENALYLFYILTGKLLYHHTGQVLIAGDCISAKSIQSSEVFEFIEDTSLLMITQKDFYDHQASYLDQLTIEMNKIQEKDHYTREHCDRTGKMAVRIGIKLGLKDQAINQLLFASKIHDLGKVDIALELLNKPGSYSSEEMEEMKRHSNFGYMRIKDFIDERTAMIVKQHHEKCDGSGYPDGLTHEDILIESKILAVADAFDALVTDRPYRKGYSVKNAMAILKEGKGTLWDEEVLTCLEGILTELNEKKLSELEEL